MNTNIRNKIITIIFAIIVFFVIKIDAENAVTYEQSPGRFGDNLLCYMHAKWVSFKYNIPLLYKPFKYSDKLELHKHEYLYSKDAEKRFKKKIYVTREALINPSQDSVLYIIPYFPESDWEQRTTKGFDGKKWPYLQVDWNNKVFIEQLRSLIKPLIKIPQLPIPEGRMSVALHMRKGGTHDKQWDIDPFPLKFLHDDFYADQLKNLYELAQKKPLYVYLFTDDVKPARLVHNLQQRCKGLDIIFDYNRGENSDKTNVVEDFFALGQFDCLIRSESNYSFVMSKISEYKIEIYPTWCTKTKNKVSYSVHVANRINK